jgi:hypothetical protein
VRPSRTSKLREAELAAERAALRARKAEAEAEAEAGHDREDVGELFG